MCVTSLCTRAALDTSARGRSTAALAGEMMRPRAAVIFAMLLGFSSGAFGQTEWVPSDADKVRAEQTFREYVKALRESRFGDAYAMLTPSMQQTVSEDRWSQREKEFEQASGGSPRYANIHATWYKDPQGAPLPGIYVAFDFDCRYANIDLCHEMLMLHQQSDTNFLVVRHERTLAERQREPTTSEDTADEP
jgi:hypothetical protein